MGTHDTGDGGRLRGADAAPRGRHLNNSEPLFDLRAFSAELGQRAASERIGLFREALQRANRLAFERFRGGVPATELVPARAGVVDQLLAQAYELTLQNLTDPPALVAVGGYGRSELHPGSDIDLLILLPECPDGEVRRAVEHFVTFLWDVGLEVGHSVRTVQDCVQEAERDITIATNLMEARLLGGPAELFAQMRASIGPDRIWPSKAFFAAKLAEQQARHRKFNDTAYNLEPNIKEGPGGLRDIQMVGWVAKRHFGARTLHDLVAQGFLTEAEHSALMEGQAFLWQIRFGLHMLAGRREDRLLFDHQRTLAQLFGYRDDAARLAVEHFMKRYYRTIGQLSRLNELLLQLFREEILYADAPGNPVPINNRFQSRRGFLEARDERIFRRYPFALLEVFLLMAQHPELQGVRANTIRLMRDHRHLIDERFRNDLRCRSLFMEIIRQPHGVTHELRRMHRYGILAAYLPTFGRIVGQMQHDLFHVYTVDEHTLFVIRNLRRLTVPEHRHEFPRLSAIMLRIPKPELLYLAALFHDIAKGRGGDHSTLGAVDAEAFCTDHGLSLYDTRLVVWLVRNHLVLSSTAQRKDIRDPDVINGFAAQMGDQTHLDYLYLLTVADIRATSPSLWNAWKDALLLELYEATKRALRRGLENPLAQSEAIRETRAEARAQLERDEVDLARVDQLWTRLEDEYFLRYAVDEVVWHAHGILAPGMHLPLVLIRRESQRGGTEIFIYTRAHDHLFALTTAVLERMGLTVVDARIMPSRDGYTLDTFIVLEESGAPINNVYRLHEITRNLEDALSHPAARRPARIDRRVSRQLKHFPTPTEVHFRQDARGQYTVMEVITSDRPGLLAHIARALLACGVRLQNAKIATFGERAEDIFFITDRDNRPLLQETTLGALRETVRQALDGSESPVPTFPATAPAPTTPEGRA
ncbi:[protein-PII] uridylyltransferase [Ectothiorhodospiraceae bacterium 2226]|nr:[protein-PII] uridylyltransferase [Ectothiorhodospiraceae bacterium 2226]